MPRPHLLPLACLLAVAIAGCNCGEAPTPPPAPNDAVDAGQTDDAGTSGDAGTVKSACEVNPCTHPGRTVCRDEGGQAVCDCDPGRHLEGDECVQDQQCTASSCNGHGTCAEAAGAVVCTCEAGWAGTNCQGCDLQNGYHPDGAGGCTTDVCKPNPCSAANTFCSDDGGKAKCACAPGHHDESGACVVDEVCTATSCSGRGTCSVASGRVSCACDTGYAGPACASCAPNFHDDGQGGCTDDPCLPNPCQAANKGQCAKSGATTSGYVCGCDPGFHDDGVGNCTDDPCRPNPCAATNQACQAGSGGSYTCFTPVCDDQNPCTADSVSGGVCVHTPLADGSSCSTGLCTLGESCSAGVCSGGAPVDCDDDNPCTVDSCDAAAGCTNGVDDSLVPDDGIACTADLCSGGVASHSPQDSLCDDAKWCTGTEKCAPADPNAVNGCVHLQVPAPPPLPFSPCASYGACDEGSRSFPLVKLAAGTSCNDGLACTGNDRCTTDGVCAGAPIAGCSGALGCSTTSSWPGDVDFSMAVLEGNFTLAGAALPQTAAKSEGADLYLIDRTTGTRTHIGGPDYAWSSTQQTYVLIAATATYSTKVLPGVYDLLYRRGTYASGGTTWTYRTDATDTLANGEQILARDLVIGLGVNRRNIDLSLTALSGSFSLDGGALPATAAKSEGADFYLVDTTTGTRTHIGGPDYAWNSSQQKYLLMSGTSTYAVKVLPGTYDLLYARGTYVSSGRTYTYRTDATDTLANGEQYLKRNVVITPGSQTLDIDFSLTSLTGAFTLNGGALPADAAKSEGADFYLIDRTTGARTYIGGPDYAWNSTQQKYLLMTGTASYAAKVLPGTYDLLYSRGTYTSSGEIYTYRTDSTDTLANGEQLLRTGIVVAAGARTLDIDFSLTSLDGAFTLDGGALPGTAAKSEGADLYLIDRTTGARSHIGGPDYAWNSTQQKYLLMPSTASYSAKVLPGTYDLLYSRGTYDSSGVTYTYATDPADTLANGRQILLRDLQLAAGAQTRNIDFSLTKLSGSFTLHGASLPATAAKSEGADLYLIDRTTGARTLIGGPDYSWNSTQQKYVLIAGTASYLANVLPGTYDLLYSRGTYSSDGITWTYQTDTDDTLANGEQLLATGLVIAPGSQSRPIDLSVSSPSGNFTFGGGALPATAAKSEGASFSLIDRSTGARTYIGGPDYAWNSTRQTYVLISSTAAYAAKVLPGTYDLLYSRGTYGADGTVFTYRTDATDTLANGEQLLGRCLVVP